MHSATVNVSANSAERLAYEDRRARKLGTAFDTTILNHRSDIGELLKTLPDVGIAKTSLFMKITVRSLTRLAGPPCAGSNVFVDGFPVPFDAIQFMAPSDLRAIEVLPYEQVPKEYDVGGCGAILLWTKRSKL